MELSLFLVIAFSILSLLVLLGVETVREFIMMDKNTHSFLHDDSISERIMGGGKA